MRTLPSRLSLPIAWAAVAALALTAGAAERLTQADADRLQEKLVRITENGEAARPAALETAVSEAEVNSYIRFALAERIPPSVSDPYVALDEAGRLTVRATVDLDEVAAERSSGRGLDPLSLIGGKVPVNVVGVLNARDGVARVTLEATTISGWSVPAFVLQQLVAHYSRSERYPQGVNLQEPFDLPAGIREIRFGSSGALVIQ